MAGKALVNFADFVLETNKRMLTGPEEILNDAIKRTYLLGDMLVGKSVTDVVRGGSKLSEHLQLAKVSQFEFYKPGQSFSPSGSDTMTEANFQWRYAKDSWSWTDQEIKLNEGDEKLQYKRLAKVKRQNCELTIFDGMEDAWTSAAPDTAAMESNDGTSPYSMRCFITEAGGAPVAADGAVGTWTTVAGINPVTYPRWKNQVSNFNYLSPDTTLRKSFGQNFRKLKFKSPRTNQDLWQNTNFKKTRIFTSADGQDLYERVLAEGNDLFNPRNDAGGITENPIFRGLPVEYIEAIDDIAFTAGQPRYYWLNLDFIYPVFHEGRYFEEMPPVNGAAVGQPENWVVYKLCWYNIVCRSRYRQGIIVPNATAA